MATNTFPDVTIADDNDNPIGHMQLPDAIAAGHWRQVVNVFITNSDGHLLLQQRSAAVLWPHTWHESAAGHVDFGDTYDVTAKKELREEAGISGIELTKFAVYKDAMGGDKRFHHCYKGQYDGLINKQLSEVEDLQWFSLAHIDAWLERSMQDFTPHFPNLYKLFKESGI